MKRLPAIALSLAAGAAFSWGKLAFHCRRPVSEACVWGKAWMPFTFPLETILVGALVYGVWWVVVRQRAKPGGTAEH